MNTGDYTSIEWLQIAAFLVGMPVAAIFGAMLGLAGKWKQGRVMTAALVGLGGAAIASAILFLTFVVLFSFYADIRGETIVDYFNQIFGRQVTWMPLLCAAVIAVLAGIGLRSRPRDETSRLASLSMRQLLLLQIFTFVTLGCWTGLRMWTLGRLSTMERAQRNWTKEEDWQVLRTRDGEPVGMAGGESFTSEASGDANRRFLKALDESWLKELHLQGIGDFKAYDFSQLHRAAKLETLWLWARDDAQGNQKLIDDLATAPALRELQLYCLTSSVSDFSPLAKIASLRSLNLGGGPLDFDVIRTLKHCKSLETLSFAEMQLTTAANLNDLPPALRHLGIERYKHAGNWSILGIEKQTELQTLSIRGGRLTRDEIEQIASLPKLETLYLDCSFDVENLPLLQKLSTAKSLTLLHPLPRKKRPECRKAILKLAENPSLTGITFNFDCVLEPEQEDWDVYSQNAANEKDLERRVNSFWEAMKQMRRERGLPEVKASLTRSMISPSTSTP